MSEAFYDSSLTGEELDEIGNKRVQVEVPNIKLDDLRDAKFTISEMEALSLLISQ